MSSDNAKETGCVKWFNDKSGYGFISSCDGDDDVFVHHTSLSVTGEQYRYLVAGEYVEYSKEPASNDHEWQATNVTGVKGGKLMCETRNEIRAASSNGDSDNERRGSKSGSVRKGKGKGKRSEGSEYLSVGHSE